MDRHHTHMLPFRDLFVSMRDMEYVTVTVGESTSIQHKSSLMLFFVMEGAGEFHTTHMQHQVLANEMLVVQSGNLLKINNNGDLQLRFFVITCEAHHIEGNSSKQGVGKQNEIIPFLVDDIVMSLVGPIEDMVKELFKYASSTNKKEQFDNHFLFQKLIYTLVDQQQFQKQSIDPYQAVKRTIYYLSRHYHEAVTIEQLAKMAKLSRRWYTILFKEITGENPRDYLTGLRIRKAKDLINLSRDSFYEIARRVGFEDEHYFSRRFKQNVGMSPRFYLQNRRLLGTTVTSPELLHVLGHTPIAASAVQQDFPTYLEEPFKHVHKLTRDKSLNINNIRSYKPDLIIASEWQDKDHYDELSRIATTVLLPERQDWRDELRDMGEVLGNGSEAVQAIQYYEDKLDRAREQLHPLVQNESIVYVRVTSEGMIAYGNKSSRGKILYSELGLKLPTGSQLQDYGALLSIEQLSLLQSDHILLQIDHTAGSKESLLNCSEWKQLSAVKHNQVYLVGNKEWFNFSFSPLSTSFAIGEIVNIFERKGLKHKA